jgi:hypothetical protein
MKKSMVAILALALLTLTFITRVQAQMTSNGISPRLSLTVSARW